MGNGLTFTLERMRDRSHSKVDIVSNAKLLTEIQFFYMVQALLKIFTKIESQKFWKVF